MPHRSRLITKGSRYVLEALLAHIPEGLIIVGEDLTVTAVSEFASAQYGRPRNLIEGLPLEDLLSRYHFLTPNGRAVGMDDLPIVRALRRGEEVLNEQWVIEDATGHRVTTLADAAPVRTPDGKIVGAVASWADISALKELENDLRNALEGGNILLGEAHHRFKNHLQMLSSLIAVESRREGATARSIARVMGNRFDALATAQASFQGSEGNVVDAGSLVDSICRILDSDRHPVKGASDAGVGIHADRTAPLALLINEGVTNALKHAFPDGRPGLVTVELHRQGDELILEITDEGIGLAEVPRSGGMGMKIFDALARQLSGAITLTNGPERGAVLRATFPA